MKVGADMQHKKENIKSQEMRAGTQIGVDIAKTKSQQDLTARQAALDHGREMEDKRIDASKTALEHGRNSADRLHTIHKEELDRKQENLRMEQQARQASRSKTKGET